MIKNRIIKFLPAIFWMLIIFYFSSIPTTSIIGSSTTRFLILKSFHLIEYAILSILVYLAVSNYRKTLIISYLYSLSDEFHQYFIPGRTSKFTDTLIDLIGISLGIMLLKIIFSRSPRLHRLLEKIF